MKKNPIVAISLTVMIIMLAINLFRLNDKEIKEEAKTEEIITADVKWQVTGELVLAKMVREEYTVGTKYLLELANGSVIEVTEEEFNKISTGDTKFFEICEEGNCKGQQKELGSES